MYMMANTLTLIDWVACCLRNPLNAFLLQVTQFILENASNKSQPCRIICTQPRRISALSVAERVATERGEKIAQIVGYQIRLDSRSVPTMGY